MNHWSYRILNCRCEGFALPTERETEMDRLGAEGWELVGMASINFKNGATDHVAMVFKRPVTA